MISRSVEKRKHAASELQDIIEKLMQNNHTEKIYSIISMFAAMANADT